MIVRAGHATASIQFQAFVASNLALTRSYAKSPKYNPQGANIGVIQTLLRHRDDEDTKPDRNLYKIRAFDSAVKQIDTLNYPISTGIDIRETLPGVGDGIARRIREHLDENGDSKSVKEDTPEFKRRRQSLRELQKVAGIGPVKARDLVDQGCHSFDDLRRPNFRNQLSKMQLAALDFSDHLTIPVTRDDAEAVQRAMTDCLGSNWDLQLVGSYRRGGTLMSDIDMLLFHPSYNEEPVPPSDNDEDSPLTENTGKKRTMKRPRIILPISFENEVIVRMRKSGILARTLNSGPTKWQGFIRIPRSDESESDRLLGVEKLDGHFKRMDMLLISQKCRGPAILAHTGDADFNRYCRLHAAQLGMKLNEHGLWKDTHLSPGEEDYSQRWRLVDGDSEESILSEICVDYMEPGKRNFSNINKQTIAAKSRAKKRKLL